MKPPKLIKMTNTHNKLFTVYKIIANSNYLINPIIVYKYY